MLDGVPIFDIDKVVAIDPLKVRKLDVVNSRYFWGAGDAEGILSYTTYKGDLGGVELDPHAVVLDYEGLQLQRVFYSPAYETDKENRQSRAGFLRECTILGADGQYRRAGQKTGQLLHRRPGRQFYRYYSGFNS